MRGFTNEQFDLPVYDADDQFPQPVVENFPEQQYFENDISPLVCMFQSSFILSFFF